jgi:lysophosphatidate acyltransferase
MTPALLPFKRGAVVIAMEAGNIPLVPIVIANSSHVFHVPGKHFASGTIRVRVLDPIEIAPKATETKEQVLHRVLKELRCQMLQTVQQISSA